MKGIQRKRTKGFKLPENTVCVNRGTKWGNPFRLIGGMIYINAKYRRRSLDPWVFYSNGNLHDVVSLYESLVNQTMVATDRDEAHWLSHFKCLDISELKGKNLACFCGLDVECHRDILLKLANHVH